MARFFKAGLGLGIQKVGVSLDLRSNELSDTLWTFQKKKNGWQLNSQLLAAGCYVVSIQFLLPCIQNNRRLFDPSNTSSKTAAVTP